jgi:hypothetical protein
MIMAFKASLYASAQKLDRRDIDLDDALWIDRVNRYFDGANGFPATGDPREYEAAFTAMYPAAEDRRRYIAEAVERGTPSYGQRVLGTAAGLVDTPSVGRGPAGRMSPCPRSSLLSSSVMSCESPVAVS